MTAPALRCSRLTVGFGDSVVLESLDLEVGSSETVTLLGPSGSGKTTLLYAVAGLVELRTGTIELAGRRMSSAIGPERRSLGMVFQNYALWPHLNARRTVAYPLERRGVAARAAIAEAERLLDLVGIGDLGDRLPDQLSGGQQQRVGLARALALEPALYLFDEPTAHLDSGLRVALQRELVEQRARTGAAALYTTHDASEALSVADRVAVLRSGRIVQVDTPQRIYREPCDAWTAQLTGPASVLPCELVGEGNRRIEIVLEGRRLHVTGGSATSLGTSDLVVRPDWVTLGGERSGRVASVTYDGPHTDYTIITDGGPLVIRRPGPPCLSVGDRTGWSLRRGWAVNPR